MYEHLRFEAPHAVALFGDQRDGLRDAAAGDTAGNDQLQLLYDEVSFTAAAPVVHTMAAGGGDDEVTYLLNDCAGDLHLTLNIDAGVGRDEVLALLNVTTDSLTADVDIQLGAGNDVGVFVLLVSAGTTAPAVDLDVEMHGGDGRDLMAALVVLARNTTGRLNVGVHGEDENDRLLLAVFGADSIDELFLLLDGGRGFDFGLATENVEVEDVERLLVI